MSAAETPTDRRIVPLTGLRGVIARTMSQGWEAPRVALGLDVDLGATMARRATIRIDRRRLT